ncbi:MAG TPA: 50S ribosomal protein L17 [Methylomirabilota bacterium]
MRHKVAHRKLGRDTQHRLALLRNQATALLRHERIETTVPKAKELRPYVERLITIAKRGVVSGDAIRVLTARRLVLQDIQDRAVVGKLFDDLAPRFADRPGGYTRLMRVGFRRGDSAEVAQIELVGSEFNPNAEEAGAEGAAEKPSAKKGVGARIKAAAERVRGRKEEGREAAPKAKASTKAAGGRKVSAPRKAGGS